MNSSDVSRQHIPERYAAEKGSPGFSITVETTDNTSQTSTDNGSTTLQAQIQSIQRTRLERFGPCAAVFLGIILLLIALPVVAISLIWYQEDFSPRAMLIKGDGVPQFATAATGGMAPTPQEITIQFCRQSSSLVYNIVLRVGILLMSGVCTAIIASLVLRDRHDGVPLGATAGFSLLRFCRSDPIFLVSEFILAAKHTKPAQRRRLAWYFLLASVLLITTIFFQFSGTLLLMDMQFRYVSDTETIERIPAWSQKLDGLASDVANVWYTRPHKIIPFAQYKPDTTPNLKDGWDTGKTMRGFLPFDSAPARNSIKSLQGPLPVLDAQYACFRPTRFTASLSRGINSGPTSFYVSGSAVADAAQGGSVPQSWSSPVETTFNCTIPTRGTGSKREDTPLGLCDAFLKQGAPGSDRPKIYIVFNVDGTLPEWESYYKSISNSGATASIHMIPNRGWMELGNFEGGNIRLAATMCYTKHTLQLLQSTITREAPADSQLEPQVLWDNVRGRYNMDNIREFFTSDHPSHTLSLGPSAPTTATDKFHWLMESLLLTGRPSAIFCISCDYSADRAIKVDSLKSTLVQDTLRVTGNPALMLQTLFTILFQESYYQATPMYDSLEALSVIRLVVRQSPEGCNGYTIVVGTLIFYAVFVGGLMLAFVRWSRDSLLGNAWSAVGQIVSRQETEDFVKLATDMTDAEVRKHLKGRDRD